MWLPLAGNFSTCIPMASGLRLNKHPPPPKTKCFRAVPSSSLPEAFRYDETSRSIFVDTGEFGPVEKFVWDYEVSGLKVVQS